MFKCKLAPSVLYATLVQRKRGKCPSVLVMLVYTGFVVPTSRNTDF